MYVEAAARNYFDSMVNNRPGGGETWPMRIVKFVIFTEPLITNPDLYSSITISTTPDKVTRFGGSGIDKTYIIRELSDSGRLSIILSLKAAQIRMIEEYLPRHISVFIKGGQWNLRDSYDGRRY